MQRLDTEIARTEAFFRSLVPTFHVDWDDVNFVENIESYRVDKKYRMPKKALLTRFAYGPIFEKMIEECSWINFNAFGVLGNSLLINLEYPTNRAKHGAPHLVSINLSGPPMTSVSKDVEPLSFAVLRQVEGLGSMQFSWCLDELVLLTDN